MDLAPRRPTRHGSRQFFAHLIIVPVVLVTAVVAGRPSLLGLAGPSLGLLCLAIMTSRPPSVDLTATFDRRRGIEGDLATLVVRVSAVSSATSVDLSVDFPPALQAQGPTRHLVRVQGGGHTDIAIPVVMTQWGMSAPRQIVVRTSDAHGLLSRRQEFGCRCRLRTLLPDPDTRSLLDPTTFLRIVGNHTSRGAGDGCELADARPYRPGDRLRNINWRITARLDEPWITERHPDRATTVVVVVDAAQDAGVEGHRALRRSARFAMALAQAHLRVNDQVGLAIVGRKHRWIQPRAGRLQLERITDGLLEINSEAERGETVKLASVLPADAIVTIVSASPSVDLLDQLRSLMARGHLLHVVQPEIATSAAAAPPSLAPRPVRDLLFRVGLVGDDDRSAHIAARLFAVEQEWRRRELRSAGFSIMSWRLDEPVESVLLGLKTSQRARSIHGAPAALEGDLV